MKSKSQIIVINGPNLNLLGERQPEIYGHMTLSQIGRELRAAARQAGFQLLWRQSNYEGEIVDWLHKYRKGVAGIIINPAAYSHTSVAILDALLALEVPAVEVHLSNIYQREEFRQKSITARGCVGVISGLGASGYFLALQFLLEHHKG